MWLPYARGQPRACGGLVVASRSVMTRPSGTNLLLTKIALTRPVAGRREDRAYTGVAVCCRGPSNALVRYTRIAVPRRPGPARGGFESPRYRERSFTYSRQSICNTGVDSWLCDVALSRSLANSSLVPLPIAPRSAPLDQMLLMNLAHQRSPSIR